MFARLLQRTNHAECPVEQSRTIGRRTTFNCQESQHSHFQGVQMMKPLAREKQRLTKSIRTGGAPTAGVSTADPDEAMVDSPLENLLKKILKKETPRPRPLFHPSPPSKSNPPPPLKRDPSLRPAVTSPPRVSLDRSALTNDSSTMTKEGTVPKT